MKAIYPESFQCMNEQTVDILDSVSDAILVVDWECRVVYVNKAIGQLLGRDVSELRGKNVVDLIPKSSGWMFYTHLDKAISERVEVKLENYRFNDRRFTAYFYPGKNGITIFFHDITV